MSATISTHPREFIAYFGTLTTLLRFILPIRWWVFFIRLCALTVFQKKRKNKKNGLNYFGFGVQKNVQKLKRKQI